MLDCIKLFIELSDTFAFGLLFMLAFVFVVERRAVGGGGRVGLDVGMDVMDGGLQEEEGEKKGDEEERVVN